MAAVALSGANKVHETYPNRHLDCRETADRDSRNSVRRHALQLIEP
jgi:hypothetical protein